LELQRQLIDAAKAWASGCDDVGTADALREETLILLHERYRQRIPLYRHLAEQSGVNRPCDLPTLVNNMMFSTDIFKSYDPHWLDDCNFSAMTSWLDNLCAEGIASSLDSVSSFADWSESLAKLGIRLSYSSGTSGVMSLIPRDPLTWRALCRNSSLCGNEAWYHGIDGRRRKFDCLITVPPGDGTGIQGAGNGFATIATRSHYLYSSQGVITAEEILKHGRKPIEEKSRNQKLSLGLDLEKAICFIREGLEANRPLLIFGPPFQLKQLCESVRAKYGSVKTHSESIVVTGGGWKSFHGERISQEQLCGEVFEVFGIGCDQVSDAYSTTELNCTLTCCKAFHYHVPPLLEVVILDEAYLGIPRQSGRGYIGFMDPFAMSYPGFLIPGDIAELGYGECRCGLTGWYLVGPIQRLETAEVKGCGGVMESLLA
jgi:hypothetical protein